MTDQNTPDDEMNQRPAPARAPMPVQPLAPLPYESGVDRAKRKTSPNALLAVFMFGLGFCISGGGVLLSGAFVAMPFAGNHTRAPLIGALFIVFFVFVAVGLARFMRQGPIATLERWFLLGCLIGFGMALLLDGVCFSLASF